MQLSGERVLIIAEVASGHDGRPDLAVELAQLAAQAGADAVKFQIFRADELVVRDHPKAGAFRQIEIQRADWTKVVRAAREAGLRVLADVYDQASLELAEALGIEAYKITTTITGDRDLLRALAKTGKPLLVAVSGETEDEISSVLNVLKAESAGELVLHHGFQGFPTQIEDTHLRRLEWLRDRFGVSVGFADHCAGDHPICQVLPVVAVGLGARVIEKHLTKDRSSKSRDWVSALNPDEFRRMADWIREAERALGQRCPALSESEVRYHESMQKKVVAREALKRGTILTRKHLAMKRTPALGAGPECVEALLGKKLLRDVVSEGALTPEDVESPRTLILIAVRMKSTRLPGKALLPIAGKPVLDHLVERLRLAAAVGNLVLCTSSHPQDRVLLEEAARLGIEAYAGSEDNVMARFLDVAERQHADVVVRVTGDNPLTDPDAIEAMVRQHCAEGADYTFTDDLPRGTRPEVISVPALRRAHDLAEDPSGSEYMTLYFKNNPAVFTLGRWSVPNPELRRPMYRLTLDTPEDLKVLEFVYGRLCRDGRVFPLSEVVQLLDASPECVSWNAQVPSRVPPEINARLKVTA
jgi:N,N'-diacetyllegionaminate synthase